MNTRLPSDLLSPSILAQFRTALVARRGQLDEQVFEKRLAQLARGLGDIETVSAAAVPGRFAPCVLLRDFMDHARLDDVCAQIRGVPGLQPAQVGIEPRVDRSVRVAYVADASQALRGLVVPAIRHAIETHELSRTLGLAGPADGRVELQLTAYASGGTYKPHVDRGDGLHTRCLTFVWFLHDEPATFTGGDLLLYDAPGETVDGEPAWMTRIRPVRNTAVFFSTDRVHQVTEVLAASPDPLSGRVVLIGWVHMAGTTPED